VVIAAAVVAVVVLEPQVIYPFLLGQALQLPWVAVVQVVQITLLGVLVVTIQSSTPLPQLAVAVAAQVLRPMRVLMEALVEALLVILALNWQAV
jgi:hypothetical protein